MLHLIKAEIHRKWINICILKLIRLPLHYLWCNVLRVVCFFTTMSLHFFVVFCIFFLMNLLIMSYFLSETDFVVFVLKRTLLLLHKLLTFDSVSWIIMNEWWSGSFICFLWNVIRFFTSLPDCGWFRRQ